MSGAVLLLLGAAATGLSPAFEGPPAATVVGGNFPVNAGAVDARDLSAHNSPLLVRNPVDGANLAIANRIDTPRFSCALHVSADGGATWSQTPLPVPEGEEPKCYAPDVAFGADGTLYLTFVTLKGRGNVPNAVWIATSPDGGSTLSRPARAVGPLAFQVRLVADPAVPRRLYLTWLQASDTASLAFPETGYPIRSARSDDGGMTWGYRRRVSDTSRQRVLAPSPVVTPTGELYVAYLDLGDDRLDYEGAHEGRGGPPYAGTWQLIVARSGDGGSSWTESLVEDRLVPTQRFVVFLPALPSVAVDPGSGGIYVAFHDARLGDPDVWLWTSRDRGATWSEPTRVNDTPVRDGTAQYLPKLAVAPDGRLDVAYYDRRADPTGARNEVSLQFSVEGGARFVPRLRLSDRAFDSRVGFGSERGMADLGSRLGLLSTEHHALAAWTDTRAGTQASGKQDLVRALVAFSGPESTALQRGLRWVGLALVLAGSGGLAWDAVRPRYDPPLRGQGSSP